MRIRWGFITVMTLTWGTLGYFAAREELGREGWIIIGIFLVISVGVWLEV